jgi:hypothetical protein
MGQGIRSWHAMKWLLMPHVIGGVMSDAFAMMRPARSLLVCERVAQVTSLVGATFHSPSSFIKNA